ncbi:hypothetical protein [Caldicellulosiruptor acetigenus]|uniref:Uncharacterized protein n=1 Tax=Caldicellulosiruptor acetigenus 6A TaxID=632516 RepID=G2PYR7_9FIRM|nr:hypothetical protein [Caldicellulosiruptor acetigenus]AEM74986.1 hypothetical protein Calla_2460 [Caldicellulosiruptor acetigenus 6A]
MQIRVRQYVLQENGLDSWWDFRMPYEDYLVTLPELLIQLKHYRFSMKLFNVVPRYTKVLFFKNGICLVYRFGMLITKRDPNLPLTDLNCPTEVINYDGREWYIEEFGSALVIGNVDANKLKAKLDKFEKRWKRNYYKTRKRDIQICIKNLQNRDPELDDRILEIYQKVTEE